MRSTKEHLTVILENLRKLNEANPQIPRLPFNIEIKWTGSLKDDLSKIYDTVQRLLQQPSVNKLGFGLGSFNDKSNRQSLGAGVFQKMQHGIQAANIGVWISAGADYNHLKTLVRDAIEHISGIKVTSLRLTRAGR
jgi:hypothetical protein